MYARDGAVIQTEADRRRCDSIGALFVAFACADELLLANSMKAAVAIGYIACGSSAGFFS